MFRIKASCVHFYSLIPVFIRKKTCLNLSKRIEEEIAWNIRKLMVREFRPISGLDWRHEFFCWPVELHITTSAHKSLGQNMVLEYFHVSLKFETIKGRAMIYFSFNFATLEYASQSRLGDGVSKVRN